jgi:ribulose-5-phosphate 4-epimerase/fuculose-1-phosphate aldolase
MEALRVKVLLNECVSVCLCVLVCGRSHGLLVAGSDVAKTFFLYYALQRACEVRQNTHYTYEDWPPLVRVLS